MKGSSLIHSIGVIFSLAAVIIFLDLIWRINFGGYQGEVEVEEEGFQILNLAAGAIVALLFGGLFFLWNISAEINDFLKAFFIVEKGEKKDGK